MTTSFFSSLTSLYQSMKTYFQCRNAIGITASFKSLPSFFLCMHRDSRLSLVRGIKMEVEILIDPTVLMWDVIIELGKAQKISSFFVKSSLQLQELHIQSICSFSLQTRNPHQNCTWFTWPVLQEAGLMWYPATFAALTISPAFSPSKDFHFL